MSKRVFPTTCGLLFKSVVADGIKHDLFSLAHNLAKGKQLTSSLRFFEATSRRILWMFQEFFGCKKQTITVNIDNSSWLDIARSPGIRVVEHTTQALLQGFQPRSVSHNALVYKLLYLNPGQAPKPGLFIREQHEQPKPLLPPKGAAKIPDRRSSIHMSWSSCTGLSMMLYLLQL